MYSHWDIFVAEPVRKLLYNYSQDTTLHGVRYVTTPTKYVMRR